MLAGAAPGAAADPPLTVPKAKLDAALHCHGKLQGAKRQPIMLVTGTGATGDEAYAIGKGAFDAYEHPVCTVNFPDFTTADIEVSVQYLVNGIRSMERRAGRPIAVIGISQGGLLPRFALTYWPSLRAQVTDVLAAAGTEHGTTLFDPAACAADGCAPAVWQQAPGPSSWPPSTPSPTRRPGPTAWTTVRSATDEVVQPQTGPHPTSALKGATNILIQSVCPGRLVSHIGTVLDSVTFAAFTDAIAHKGAARIARLPKDVCAHPYAPGLDEAGTNAILGASGNLITPRLVNQVPRVAAEPPVRAYARRRGRLTQGHGGQRSRLARDVRCRGIRRRPDRPHAHHDDDRRALRGRRVRRERRGGDRRRLARVDHAVRVAHRGRNRPIDRDQPVARRRARDGAEPPRPAGSIRRRPEPATAAAGWRRRAAGRSPARSA